MFMTILPALMAALVVGGYSLVSRLADVRDTNAQRQQLVTDSFAARLESTPASDTARQQQLLRQLLEARDVRAATLEFEDDRPALHAGPRLRPVTAINQDDVGQRHLIAETIWPFPIGDQPRTGFKPDLDHLARPALHGVLIQSARCQHAQDLEVLDRVNIACNGLGEPPHGRPHQRVGGQ